MSDYDDFPATICNSRRGLRLRLIALHEYSDKYKPLLSGDESRGPQSSIVITITMMIKEYK